ncbi:MAG: hypothetical protein ACYDGY_08515 [Acidimicrobiales bacterium]
MQVQRWLLDGLQSIARQVELGRLAGIQLRQRWCCLMTSSGRDPDPAHVCFTEEIIISMSPVWVAEVMRSLVGFNISHQLGS